MYVLPVHISTLTSIVNLLLTFDLSLMPLNIFWTPETIQLLTLYSFDLHKPGTYFHGTFDSAVFPMVLGECIYLHTTRNTWTVTEGQHSARAEASVQTPLNSGTTRLYLRVG